MWSSAIPRRSVVKYSTPLGPVSCDLATCSPRRRASVILSRFSRNHALCSLTSHTAQPRPVAFTPPSPGKRQARAPTLDSVDPACLVRIRSFDEAVSSRSHPPKARSLPPKPPRGELALSKRKRTRLRPRPLRPRRLDCPSTASPESEAVNVIVGTFSTDEVTIDQYTEPESHMEPTPDGPRQTGHQVRQEPA